MIAVIGVLALLATSAFVLRAVTGGGGGASSPEDAVQALADAIGSEDPAALASALAPDEVRSLSLLLDEVEQQAEEGGLAGPQRTFSGIDVSIADLELEVDELGDDVARVTVRDGAIGYEVEREGLSDRTRSLLPEDLDESGSVGVDDFEDDEIEDFYLMTVRQGGGWYVSLTYTAASYAAEIWGLPEGDFDDDVELGDAAETPEDAARELVEAGGSLDVEGVRDRLPEGEWSVLGAYERAIEEVIEGDSDEVDLDITDLELEVDDVSLEVEGSSSTRKVVIAGAEGSVQWTDIDGEQGADWELDGWCMEVSEYDGDGSEGCLFDDDALFGQVFDLGDPYVVVMEERSGWVVSPTATVVEMARELVPQITPDLFLNLIGRPDRIEPSGEIALGESVDVEVGPAGASTYSFTPDEDASVIVDSQSGDDWVEVSLIDAAGEWVDSAEGWGQEVVAGEEYRVVLEGAVGAPVEIALGRVSVEDLPGDAFAAGLSGRLDLTTPVRQYRFSPPDDVAMTMTVSDAVQASISGGDEYCEVYPGESGSCSFQSGSDYVLTITSADDDPDVPFTVSFEEGGDATVDGDTFTTGSMYEDENAYHQLSVAEGVTATVVVTADDGESDIDVGWDQGTETSVGAVEEFTVYGPFDGELELYVYSAYSSPVGYSIEVYAE